MKNAKNLYSTFQILLCHTFKSWTITKCHITPKIIIFRNNLVTLSSHSSVTPVTMMSKMSKVWRKLNVKSGHIMKNYCLVPRFNGFFVLSARGFCIRKYRPYYSSPRRIIIGEFERAFHLKHIIIYSWYMTIRQFKKYIQFKKSCSPS